MALHWRSSNIEVAVAESDRLVNVGCQGDFKRRGLGHIEDFNLVSFDLNCPSGEFRVCRSLRALPNEAGDPEHIFTPHIAGGFVGTRGDLRIEDHLGQAISISQVNENEPTKVAAAIHPS